jgi:hypothetical protein
MERTIVFVVGLPGSGKSSYLEQLQKSGFITINNPDDFDRDILPVLNEQTQVIAIADYNLCFPSYREKMVVKIRSIVADVVFRWIYFENDPIQCLSNLRASSSRIGDDTRENFVWQVSQGYSIPANVEAKPVSKSENATKIAWPSYTPNNSVDKSFKLVRVLDDLVIFASTDWENFRSTTWYILQKYPTHRYMIVEETITRNVKEVLFDGLVSA